MTNEQDGTTSLTPEQSEQKQLGFNDEQWATYSGLSIGEQRAVAIVTREALAIIASRRTLADARRTADNETVVIEAYKEDIGRYAKDLGHTGLSLIPVQAVEFIPVAEAS